MRVTSRPIIKQQIIFKTILTPDEIFFSNILVDTHVSAITLNIKHCAHHMKQPKRFNLLEADVGCKVSALPSYRNSDELLMSQT